MFNIKVKVKDFLRAIRIVENAIDDTRIDDKTNAISIETAGDKLIFKAIGFNMFIKCECKAMIIEEGKILLKYKLIEELLRKIDDEEVDIEEQNANSIIFKTKGNKVNCKLYPYTPNTEINMNIGNEYIFDKKVLMDAIENTVFCASTDSSKVNINCLKFDINDKVLKLVAADIARMIYKEIEIKENLNSKEAMSINLPLKAINALIKIYKDTISDEILLKTEGTKALFKFEDVEIYTKLSEAIFPDYQKEVLDKLEVNYKVSVAQKSLQKKLEIVNLFVKDKVQKKDVAELIFSEELLTIIGENDTAKTEQQIKIQSDANMKVFLNIKFITEYLSKLKNDDIINIYMSGERKAIQFKEKIESNDVYIIMPLI